MVVRDVFHIDGFVKVSVLVSSAPPTQLFGGNGHPTAAQQIVHCFALRDCSGVFTTLFGRGRRGGRGGGGRGGGGRGRGEGRVGTKLLLFQCSQSSTFRHFDVLAWHVSQFVWVQCRETVLAGAHLRWGRKRGAENGKEDFGEDFGANLQKFENRVDRGRQRVHCDLCRISTVGCVVWRGRKFGFVDACCESTGCRLPGRGKKEPSEAF